MNKKRAHNERVFSLLYLAVSTPFFFGIQLGIYRILQRALFTQARLVCQEPLPVWPFRVVWIFSLLTVGYCAYRFGRACREIAQEEAG